MSELDVRELMERYDAERDKVVEQWRKRYLRWLRVQTPGRDGKLRDVPPFTPWLPIRYSATDLGARPLPPGTVFWASPDIWVESSDPLGNPVAGQDNFLHARLFNLGAFPAAPVKVDFYWADPSLGLGPGTMNLVGSEWVEVPSLSSVDVRCSESWKPVVVNDGHECVMVNCSNHVLDPIWHPFQPTLDRHVAQRNLHVVTAQPGMTMFLTSCTRPTSCRSEPRLCSAGRSPRLEPAVAFGRLPAGEAAALAAAFGSGALDVEATAASAYRDGTAARNDAARIDALRARVSVPEEPPALRFAERGSEDDAIRAELGESLGYAGQGGPGHAGDLLTALGRVPRDARAASRSERRWSAACSKRERSAQRGSTCWFPTTCGPASSSSSPSPSSPDRSPRAATPWSPSSSSRRGGRRKGVSMPNDYSREELLALVVDEVDDARDVYQLAEQLAPHLPIKSLDELVRATDGRQLRFRDAPFEVESVRPPAARHRFPRRGPRRASREAGPPRTDRAALAGGRLRRPHAARRQLHRDGGIAPGLGPRLPAVLRRWPCRRPATELGQLLAQPPTG